MADTSAASLGAPAQTANLSKHPAQGMLVGYARVSTVEQNLHLQKDALHAAGSARIFEDMLSGAREDRPGLEAVLDYVRPGDTLVVWKLDRLGRSLPHLIETVRALEARGIGFRSLCENIDTTSGGKLVFHIFAALAEFERDIIRERTAAGLVAARARGRKGGRPKVMDSKKTAMAKALRADPALAVAEICQQLGVSETTFYRYTKEKRSERAILPGFSRQVVRACYELLVSAGANSSTGRA